jgi:hypothetical protein
MSEQKIKQKKKLETEDSLRKPHLRPVRTENKAKKLKTRHSGKPHLRLVAEKPLGLQNAAHTTGQLRVKRPETLHQIAQRRHLHPQFGVRLLEVPSVRSDQRRKMLVEKRA